MAIVVPLTGQDRGLITQPRISSSGTGLNRPSFASPEDVRAIDARRLQRRLGRVTAEEIAEIRKVLRYFLDL
jgi:mRNA-degrading endonuclease toxin of MazEF toxin-antitoxin module